MSEKLSILNKLDARALEIRQSAESQIAGKIPDELVGLFSDNSFFFQEEAIADWRRSKKYDELIEYLIERFSDSGGEEMWSQILLDLRLEEEFSKAEELLSGLAKGRKEAVEIAGRNLEKHPNNYLIPVQLAITIGELMKILYEHAFLLENMESSQRDISKIKQIQKDIDKFLTLGTI